MFPEPWLLVKQVAPLQFQESIPSPGQPRMPQRHAVFWNNCEALPGFGEQGKSRKQEHGFFVILISRRSRPHFSR
jgi:hypothetical protein